MKRRITKRHKDRLFDLALVDLGERILAATGLKLGRDLSELEHFAVVHAAIEFLSTEKAGISRRRGPDPEKRPETARVDAKQVPPELKAHMRHVLGLPSDAPDSAILEGIDRQLADSAGLRAEIDRRLANVAQLEHEIADSKRRAEYWEDVREGRRSLRPEFNAPGRPTAQELDELDN